VASLTMKWKFKPWWTTLSLISTKQAIVDNHCLHFFFIISTISVI
jgi:hypothetical protein